MSLTYKGQDEQDRATFSFVQSAEDLPQDIAFSLKWYNPSTGDDGYPNSDNTSSGAYIFKPMRNDTDKKQYSKFVKQETYHADANGP